MLLNDNASKQRDLTDPPPHLPPCSHAYEQLQVLSSPPESTNFLLHTDDMESLPQLMSSILQVQLEVPPVLHNGTPLELQMSLPAAEDQVESTATPMLEFDAVGSVHATERSTELQQFYLLHLQLTANKINKLKI